MTETGHGSNVQRLGTTATYDPATQEFVLDTPDDQARKDYIGNAAQHAELAVVFAQLRGARRGRRRAGRSRRARPRRPAARETAWCSRASGSRTAVPRWVSTASTTGGSGSTDVRVPSEALLDRFATVSRRRCLLQPDRQPQPALLHDARHPRAGPGLRRVAPASTRRRSRSRWRRRTPAPGASSRRAPRRRRTCCSTTACTSGGCCRCWRRTYALHFAQQVVAGQLHDVFSGRDRRRDGPP